MSSGLLEREHGRVLNVADEQRGSTLAQDEVSGATTIHLGDVADFDDKGGQVLIVATVYTYDSLDDTAETLHLTSGLVANIAQDTAVTITPAVFDRWALVRVDDAYDTAEGTYALVPFGLYASLPPGPRDQEGEEWITAVKDGDRWVVQDVSSDNSGLLGGTGSTCCPQPCTGAGDLETLYLDSRSTSQAMATVLQAGVTYKFRVEGTYSVWDTGTYDGTTESDAMFPSHVRANTKVIFDADTAFGTLPGTEPPTPPFHLDKFQIDLGSGFAHIEPDGGPYSSPVAGHTYTFTVVGQGHAPAFRINDTPLTDNYGDLRITLEGVDAFVGTSLKYARCDHRHPGPFINALDYGADPTGVANSTAAFVAFIEAFPPAGGIGLIPAGTYKGSLSLTINTRVLILAYGATIQPLAGNVGLTISQSLGGNAPGCAVHGIVIDGQSLSGTTGIVVQDTDRASVRDWRVLNCALGVEIKSAASGAWCEEGLLDAGEILNCTKGLKYTMVAGSNGSFGEWEIRDLAISGSATSIDLSGGSVYRNVWSNVVCWPANGGTGLVINANIEDSTLSVAFETLAGVTGVTGVSVGASILNGERNFCEFKFEGSGFTNKVATAGPGFTWREGNRFQAVGDPAGIGQVILNRSDTGTKRTQLVFEAQGAWEYALGVDTAQANVQDFYLYDAIANAFLFTFTAGSTVMTLAGGVKISNAATAYSGSGAPSNTLGANGDFYFRTGTPGTSGQEIYIKVSGAWQSIGLGGGGVTGFGGTSGLADSNVNGTATTASHSDHQHKRDVNVAKAGSVIGTRNKLNFIEGTNVTITVADDSTNDKVDVTIASTGGGGGTAGTPALTFSTTNATGSSSSFVAIDATIAVFDSTAPVTQAVGDTAGTGAAGKAARRDHKHGMPGTFGASGGSHSSGFVPDPGSSAGTTKFLREDGTWVVPTGTGSVATDAIWTTKGDLAVGTGSSTAVRQGVGSDNAIIRADSTQTTGLKWVNAYYAETYIVAAQNIAASTFTKVKFDTVVSQDSSNPFSTTNNNFTCPVAGLYHVSASVGYNPNINTTNCLISIFKNGSEVFRGPQMASTAMFGMHISVSFRCAANDTLDIRVFKDTAGNSALQVNSATVSWANFEFIR